MKQSLMLIGRSGSGKTSVFETLTGSEVRNPRDVQLISRFGPEIQVKETYGFFSNDHDLQACTEDIESCIRSFPGIDVIGFVIRIGRFTSEEKEMIEIFHDTLGEMAPNFTIVIFTNLDNLIYDEVPLSEFLEESPQELQDLLSLCGGRYVGFDNKGSQEDKQGYARSLIEAMTDLQERNKFSKYTTSMFEQARRAKMVKDEEKAKQQQEKFSVLKQRMKLDMRAEVEAKVRREMEQERVQLMNNVSSEGHCGRGQEDKRLKENGKTESDRHDVETGFADLQHSKDLGTRKLQDWRNYEEHGRGIIKNKPVVDEARRGLQESHITEDQGRRRPLERCNPLDHERSGLEDRRYTADRSCRGGRRGLWDRGYAEDNGNREIRPRAYSDDHLIQELDNRRYLKNHEGKTLVFTGTDSRSEQGDRKSLQDMKTQGTQTSSKIGKQRTKHYVIRRPRDDPTQTKIDANQKSHPRDHGLTVAPKIAPTVAPKIAPTAAPKIAPTVATKPHHIKTQKARKDKHTDVKTTPETTEQSFNNTSKTNNFVDRMIRFWNHL